MKHLKSYSSSLFLAGVGLGRSKRQVYCGKHLRSPCGSSKYKVISQNPFLQSKISLQHWANTILEDLNPLTPHSGAVTIVQNDSPSLYSLHQSLYSVVNQFILSLMLTGNVKSCNMCTKCHVTSNLTIIIEHEKLSALTHTRERLCINYVNCINM